MPAVSRRPSVAVIGWLRSRSTKAVIEARGSVPSGHVGSAAHAAANASKADSAAAARASAASGSSRAAFGGPSRTTRPAAPGWVRAQVDTAVAPSPTPIADRRVTASAARTCSMSDAVDAVR
jgi:hypothetical protein